LSWRPDSCIFPEYGEVYDLVKQEITNNVAIVLQGSKKFKRLPREVALAMAKERVRKAMGLRGRLPKRRKQPLC